MVRKFESPDDVANIALVDFSSFPMANKWKGNRATLNIWMIKHAMAPFSLSLEDLELTVLVLKLPD